MTIRNSILILSLLFPLTLLFGQEKCGTVEYAQSKLGLQKNPEIITGFENWLENKIIQKKSLRKAAADCNSRMESVITIPIIVHIIHNGEALGTGVNIPDEQIYSQIEVLNEDFRRTNVDKTNTPSIFEPVAADIEVEFVLAKRDPEGIATTGIIRVQGSKTSWSMDDDVVLKSHSYWPAEDYLNIWVTNISGGLLGYGQYPVSNLEGLEDGSNNSLTDGLAIDYEVFGSKTKFPAAQLKNRYALGRTATHEMGHFLGLRHIWGDGGCSVDDFCADTPITDKSNSGHTSCSFPGPNGCGSGANDLPDMFQNYMDYTDDVCMNLFTLDQKTRMITVLENSPRRLSLLSSKGGFDPLIVANDIGIKSIVTPKPNVCDNSVDPQIELRNYGLNDVFQVSIETILDGVTIQTSSHDINLRPFETGCIDLSTISLNQNKVQNLVFRVIQTNNVTDGNSENNTKSIDLTTPMEVSLPLLEDFKNDPKDWRFESDHQDFQWQTKQLSTAPAGDSTLMLNCYNFDIQHQAAYFISPIMDLSNISFAQLSFDVAHANFNNYPDSLKIVVSTDCGNTFENNGIIYSKSGAELNTVNRTINGEFFPSSSTDWRKETINLNDYLGQKIQIGIIGVNGYGNNIFLDNLSIIATEFVDIAMSNVINPSPVSGYDTHNLTFEIANVGSKLVTSFDYAITLNDGQKQSYSVTDTSVDSGNKLIVEHELIEGISGLNKLEIELSVQEGQTEENKNNNNLTYYYTIDKSSEILPFKVEFEEELLFVTNSQFPEGIIWKPFKIGQNATMMINGATHQNKNAEEWLVTPALDLSNLTEASVYFDLAYSLGSNNISDIFEILISDNDGLDYKSTSYLKQNESLSTTQEKIEAWVPYLPEDWRKEYFDLTPYTGKNAVRMAFVFNNQQGNALYVDDFEFFVQAQPDTTIRNEKVVISPNPLQPSDQNLNLYFELANRQPVIVGIYNQMGQPLFKKELKDVLNQHFELPLSTMPEGIVIVRVIGTDFQHTERIVLLK